MHSSRILAGQALLAAGPSRRGGGSRGSRPMRRGLAAAAVIAGACASASIAVPAFAASLPSGQQITVNSQAGNTLYSASPADAVLTPATPGGGAFTGVVVAMDVDSKGRGYAVTSTYGPEPIVSISPIDAATGAIGPAVAVTIRVTPDAEPVAASECTGIDLHDGDVRVACLYTDGDPVRPDVLGIIDPATGVVVPEIELDTDLDIYELATHPGTGQLWAFGLARPGVTAYVLAGGTATPQWTTPDYFEGADFDRDGGLWITGTELTPDPGVDYPALGKLDAQTGASVFLEPFALNGEFPEATFAGITVWGEAALPATGVRLDVLSTIVAASALALGSLLAVAAGTARRAGRGGRPAQP